MGVFLRAYDRNGSALGLMPDFTDLQVQTTDNSPGSMTFKYLKDGLNAGLLDRDELFLAVVEDGTTSPDLFQLEEDTDDPASTLTQTKRRWVTVSARGYLGVLDQAVVYPKGANSTGSNLYGLKPEYAFKAMTPGAIMTDLIGAAKGRGGLNELVMSWSDTTDSAGVAWPTKHDITYTAGTNYLQVLTNMIDDGWVDVRTFGRTLQLFVPDTYFGVKSDVLRYGQNVLSAPRKRSRRDIFSHVLAAGDAEKKATVQVGNTGTASRFGRREGFVNDGNRKTTASLQWIGNVELNKHQQFKEGFTLEMAMNPPGIGEAWPRPGIEFYCGDRIYYDRYTDSAGNYLPLLVRSISKSWGDTYKQPTASIELADLFVKQTTRTAQQVAAITGGSRGGGVRQPAPQAPQRDTFPPISPTQCTIAGASELVPEGGGRKFYRAKATVTWPFVDQDSDGTALEDFDAYEVSFSINGGTWSASRISKDTTEVINNLKPGDTVRARVLAKDLSGNRSDWTYSTTVAMPVDKTPPPAPASVTITGVSELVDERVRKSYRSTATVTWPAVDQDGSVEDLNCYEVSVSINGANWTGAKDSKDTEEIISGLKPGDSVRARVLAKDWSDNHSGWTYSTTAMMPFDQTPPPAASKPILTQKLGVVTARWDGKTIAGAAMPEDFHHVVVQRSLTAAFTDGGIVVDNLYEPDATTLVTGLPYGETWWFRFVAVDVQENRSPASEVASIAVEPLVTGDLPQQVLDDVDQAISDAYNANQAAVAAQQVADAAATQDAFDLALAQINANEAAAAAAQKTADDAVPQTTFDNAIADVDSHFTLTDQTVASKNAVTNATTPPGNAANSAGDLWFQRNDLNEVIAEWIGLGGTSWQPTKLRGDLFSNIDASTITVGILPAARIADFSVDVRKFKSLSHHLY